MRVLRPRLRVEVQASDQRGTPFETVVKVSGLTKPRWNPHWYYENENWSVAEFLTQILRLRPEEFLGPWFRQLGIGIEPISALETVLCWPRFRFHRVRPRHRADRVQAAHWRDDSAGGSDGATLLCR